MMAKRMLSGRFGAEGQAAIGRLLSFHGCAAVTGALEDAVLRLERSLLEAAHGVAARLAPAEWELLAARLGDAQWAPGGPSGRILAARVLDGGQDAQAARLAGKLEAFSAWEALAAARACSWRAMRQGDPRLGGECRWWDPGVRESMPPLGEKEKP